MGFPSRQAPIHIFRLHQTKLITASGDSIVTYKVPFDCTIVKIKGGVEGIDDATALDLDPEVGTTDLLATPLNVATGSAIVSGGAESEPDNVLSLAAGDVLHLDIDITGGSSPDINGAWIEVWVVRK